MFHVSLGEGTLLEDMKTPTIRVTLPPDRVRNLGVE